MKLLEKIDSIFPDEGDVPHEFDFKPINQTEYLVNGKLRRWDGPVQQVLSPVCVRTSSGFSQKIIGSHPLLTEEESLIVLDAASNAYDNGMGSWPTMRAEERIEHLEEFARQMGERKNEVVNLLMWEIGKSYPDSLSEFDRTVDYIHGTINALKCMDYDSSWILIEEGIIGQIRRAPRGVVLCMGPSNYPLNETFTTAMPALMMGNTIVLKLPRPGSLIFYPLLEAFQKSFPEGVVNTVYGEGRKIISPLISSGKIDSLAYIGTSKVANALKRQHPKLNRLHCSFGLDAKNAAIILKDADIELSIKECITGALSFNGQRCTALKILFAHSKIVDSFIKQFAEAINKLEIGMPWEKDVYITPMPDPQKIEYLTELVEDAQAHGAEIINEAGGTQNKTFFYPALLYPVNSKMRVYKEEQFGPVIPVISFNDIEEPINYIVESDYGQQASIFGKDASIIANLIDSLVNQVARININSQCQRGPDSFPFTGRKDSAEGTLSISDALRAFSIESIVAAKETDANRTIIKKIVRENKSTVLSTEFIL
ncbi:MAG: NADP-dependent glyceraldehyde-3-phosphate dehydrogenase [Methanobacteriaceae archaeon]|jgi:glyceraldehyde-3-phosphate dehydrogenase (NADP+)